MTSETRVVAYERVVAAPSEQIFALIADPAAQPRWDGNDNLAVAAVGQRVRAVGDVFVMTLTRGSKTGRTTSSSSRRDDGSPGGRPSPGSRRRATCGAGSWSRSTTGGRWCATPTTGAC